MKVCGRCQVEKELSEFHSNPTKKDGVQSMCKSCRREYHRQHYIKNKDTYRKNISDTKKRNRAFILEYKKQCECKRCGDNRWYVLDFHHNRDKYGDMSSLVNAGVSLDTLRKEIDKCDILCSNCHREYHHFKK